jgi:glycosyltransferase involved in cell wall biosynthesis
MRLLYHCACAEGGLAEYARRQAAALALLPGVEVLWHAPESLEAPHGVSALKSLPVGPARSGNKIRRCLDFAQTTTSPLRALAGEARRNRPDAILLSTWHEYLAPFWAPAMRKLRRQGIRIGAVIHDPVRDYVLGPAWWHHWSVREAYSFVDVAFTHDVVMPETYGGRHHFQLVQIPHGPYSVPDGCSERDDLRRQFGIPREAKVLLSFGHIRNGKNLDQIISALPLLPGVHLLVAGREQSQGQRAAGFYRSLADDLGVSERCHFHTGYIPNEDIWRFFRASDVLMLTYSQDFRSASGVLNVNAQFGLPVLVSAGRSPLLDAVHRYGLGMVIERPEASLIAGAVPEAFEVKGDWAHFCADNSWDCNANKVVEALRQSSNL